MSRKYMVKRKLQEQKGSYFVVLPKIWVESLGLKESDYVSITFDGKGEVRIALREREEELKRRVEAQARTIEELQKKLNALNEEINEKENRLNALNREIEAKKGELRTIEYLRAKGFEEIRRFMDAHAWEIFTLKLNEVLKSLGIFR